MQMDKRALRREIGAMKRALSAEEIARRSAILAQRLCDTDLYREANALYAYLAFNQEVRTIPIIERAWADGKRVAVPKVVGDAMVFIWIDRLDAVAPAGAFGIPEPVADGPIADDEAALMLMPGIAFDARGHRVGYGGGYYDRYLAAHPNHPTLALCYDFQLLEHIDPDPHDLPVDRVITDY